MKHEDEMSPGELRGAKGKLETHHRLCRILSIVHEKRVGYSEGSCDCICPERQGDPNLWRSTGDALRYLEKFVEALPDGDVQVSVTERFHMGKDGRTDYHDLIVEPYTVPNEGGDT